MNGPGWPPRTGLSYPWSIRAVPASPPDRIKQLNLLQILTGCRQGFSPKGRFATKDMYALVNVIHCFRNRNQHADGQPIGVGVAVVGLLSCLELLGCLDAAARALETPTRSPVS